MAAFKVRAYAVAAAILSAPTLAPAATAYEASEVMIPMRDLADEGSLLWNRLTRAVSQNRSVRSR